ncbi:MAG: factor-independent urate hydroxylase [Gemmatimonadaceae bacterium]
MTAKLGRNSYGKSNVRLVKIKRLGDRHDIRDLTVGVFFDGDYDAVHRAGDNSHCLPTDTMKNSVYALAKMKEIGEIEEFGATLVRHFMVDDPYVARIRVEIEEHPWERLVAGGWPHPHAFSRGGGGTRVATVTGTRDGLGVDAGIDDLLVLKSADSAFSGYLTDQFTTLRPTNDRILATVISARWTYADAIDIDYALAYSLARQAMLDRFGEHESQSVQHTLFAMGEAMLERVPEITSVRLTLPNKHHLLVDLSSFGLENDNEIFVPTAEPFGLIEALITRS